MKVLVGAQNAGFTIIAQKPYSNHADDAHLITVLGEKRMADGTLKLVTWLYNDSFEGFSSGDYFYAPTPDAEFSARGHAFVSFNERSRIRGLA